MQYLYEISLNSLKDLKHIEWFLNHRDEYQITDSNTKKLIRSLLYKIPKKNIFYSDIVKEYNQLISQFENNPFNYQYDVLDDNEMEELFKNMKGHIRQEDSSPKKYIRGIESQKVSNYFVKVTDHEDNSYIVPYQYIVDNSFEYNLKDITDQFNEQLKNDRIKVLNEFEAIQDHYLNYWKNGVGKAVERYETVQYGNIKQIFKMSMQLIIYNYFLIKIMYESQYLQVISHFWQYFAEINDTSAIYSANYVFQGHAFLGILALLLITYFIYLDLYYIYGAYYIFFVKRKYDHIVNYHKEVLVLYEKFYDDWGKCKNDLLVEKVKKVNHRSSIYIPLIKKVSRKYQLFEQRTFFEHNQRVTKQRFIDVQVPYTRYYKTPINKQIKKIVLLLIFVETICNAFMIIRYF